MPTTNRSLYLLQYLWTKTDEAHTATIADMIRYLNENKITANRHTVMRDIEQLAGFGIDIICVRSRMNRYFIGSRIVELPELKLLIDAVEAARFIPQEKSEHLIGKLAVLTSNYESEQLNRNIYVTRRVKSDNIYIYYTIDLIEQAIRHGKMIEFQYYTYLPTKEKVLKFDGYFYKCHPHRIAWNNDNYYVIGYNAKYKEETVYRIDRMKSIRISDKDALPPEEGFDIDDFFKSTFLMFDGECTEVTLLCSTDTMNNIIDKFGEEVKTEYDAEKDPEHFCAYVKAGIGPTFYSWVFNYQGGIRIVAPKEAVDGFTDMIKRFS